MGSRVLYLILENGHQCWNKNKIETNKVKKGKERTLFNMTIKYTNL